jgi:hypothetical protein
VTSLDELLRELRVTALYETRRAYGFRVSRLQARQYLERFGRLDDALAALEWQTTVPERLLALAVRSIHALSGKRQRLTRAR